MNITYKEISAWISAAVLVLLYGYYFYAAPAVATRAEAFGLFVNIVILIVIVEVVSHVLAAIFHRPEQTDERDRQIGMKASRNAYYILMTGIVAVIFYLLMPEVAAATVTYKAVPSAIMAVHFLVLTSAAAEFVKFGSQIVAYRRGA